MSDVLGLKSCMVGIELRLEFVRKIALKYPTMGGNFRKEMKSENENFRQNFQAMFLGAQVGFLGKANPCWSQHPLHHTSLKFGCTWGIPGNSFCLLPAPLSLLFHTVLRPGRLTDRQGSLKQNISVGVWPLRGLAWDWREGVPSHRIVLAFSLCGLDRLTVTSSLKPLQFLYTLQSFWNCTRELFSGYFTSSNYPSWIFCLDLVWYKFCVRFHYT